MYKIAGETAERNVRSSLLRDSSYPEMLAAITPMITQRRRFPFFSVTPDTRPYASAGRGCQIAHPTRCSTMLRQQPPCSRAPVTAPFPRLNVNEQPRRRATCRPCHQQPATGSSWRAFAFHRHPPCRARCMRRCQQPKAIYTNIVEEEEISSILRDRIHLIYCESHLISTALSYLDHHQCYREQCQYQATQRPKRYRIRR